MATVASIAARRGEAEAAIKSAVASLAEKHGTELVDDTYHVRDLELRRVMDLEMVAKNLTAITDKIAPRKKEAKPEVVEDEVQIIEPSEEEKPTARKPRVIKATKKKG